MLGRHFHVYARRIGTTHLHTGARCCSVGEGGQAAERRHISKSLFLCRRCTCIHGIRHIEDLAKRKDKAAFAKEVQHVAVVRCSLNENVAFGAPFEQQ